MMGIDIDSQRICRNFVEDRVFANATSMVEYIINKDDGSAPFSIDDIVGDWEEVMEWWIVDQGLLEALQKKGEITIPHMRLWGRSQCGQAIYIDGVIEEIAKDWGLLK